MPARLTLDRATAGYGRVEVLHGLDMDVPAGSVVALLGANGAGKTTALRAISGCLPLRSGSVRLDGERIDGGSPFDVARAGVVMVPEGRGIFPVLSVADNLRVAVRAAGPLSGAERRTRIAGVLDVFPRLRERLQQRAGSLSGGEQQMLALTRALLAKPRVLLMDEISMGLAPIIVEQLFATVADLKSAGMTIVLVEQYLTYALRLADICYVLAKGRVVFVGEPAELSGRGILAETYLGAG